MRYLLAALVVFLIIAEVFQLDVSMGTGLSVKNGILTLIALFLMCRIAVSRDIGLEPTPIHAAFTVLIAYAIVSYVISGLVIGYHGYDMLAAGIRLKSELIDYFVFFLVFFHGTRSSKDALTVARALLLAAAFANLMTVLDTAGIVDLGYRIRDDGRTQGALGESNQYAAFISLFLPGMIAAVLQSRGFWRLIWLGTVLVSAIALIMTASRGAFVGLLVAAIWAAWVYRDRLSAGRVVLWLGATAVIMVIALSTFQYADLLHERLFTQTGSIDLSDASSGRVDIWGAALARMFASPLTLITGYGWDVYWTMPFRYSPHNHYLSLWFNLGLVGLICGVAALATAVRRTRQASMIADDTLRAPLIGFVIGAMALCVAVFFVDLHIPWLYFWAYVGLGLRLAVSVTERAPEQAPQPELPPRLVQADNHGWIAQPHRVSLRQ